MSVRDNLIRLMKEKGVNTLYSISQASRVPYMTIHDIYSGKKESPNIKTIKKLSDFFGVSMDEFLK